MSADCKHAYQLTGRSLRAGRADLIANEEWEPVNAWIQGVGFACKSANCQSYR